MVDTLKTVEIDLPSDAPKSSRRFGLIVIGDEILSGKRQDKHMSKLIELLNERGLSLSWVRYLPDEPDQITACLKESFASGDVVFSTGGIGATPDDHTRQCAALALGTKTQLHPSAQELIAGRIQSMAEGDPIKADLSTPENQHRFKMGEFPIGSEIIPNPYNQIPGFRIKEHYFVPGFPVMAAPMMAWCLDHFYKDLFHQENWAEQSFIVPKGIESALTPLMERIEESFPGVKVFSLPSVGDPAKEGVFAERHIELGIKGNANLLESAWLALRTGTESLGYEIHELKPQ
ncbi:competence/damage-inducible protein A [Polynucleobacter paneuropaeus]|jgi:molybdopterin-biosynthesis enzyme MoeA-like protein|nr:competence/damage-inducible protein A [Polynucleobacter paneuropaeus]MBT8610394.1 competence/damage-inducible protein A [Polynucleobacter paneuropaeus]MBT8613964.1 competence/damage-inducible protein A [Polynucleobacter paneuropaeus]MBT8615846.1 competence/damage-inducible protein A [Polynucleobacter paneuropaeus]MBT8617727.1 competence/damage-inducible protein A [Polynucleobacter paneuropaeus]